MEKKELQKQTENARLKIHIKYISGILCGCICLLIISRLCEDSVFKSCISVSSTVVSIILSVIAIILSVTGERATNEIRNKVSDSVKQLEECAEKSVCFNADLDKTINKMNLLYDNITENVIKQFPQMQTSINDLLNKKTNAEEDNPVDHIVRFYNNISPKTKEYIITALRFMYEEGSKHPIQPGDIMLHLINKGADANTSNLVIGLILGNFCTGILNGIRIDELIDKISSK